MLGRRPGDLPLARHLLPALKEGRLQAQRKSHLNNIIVMGSRYPDKFYLFRIQLRKSATHIQRDELVRFTVKNADLRNLLMRENRFQGSHVVKPVPEEAPQRDADLCANHIVYGGEGGKHYDFADDLFSCKLERRGAAERVSQDAQGIGANFPMLLLQKSLERAF